MEEITTIDLDIAKHVSQVHGVDAAGNVTIKRRLRRSEVLTFFARLQPTLIGIEACPTSHYWARELSTMGHNVKLMPPHYVKGSTPLRFSEFEGRPNLTRHRNFIQQLLEPWPVDLPPVFRTIGSWKIPVMMGGSEREDDDEDVEVQRDADRLHSAAG
jgi:transposase